MAGRIPFNPNDPYDPNAPAMLVKGGLQPNHMGDEVRDGVRFNVDYKIAVFTEEDMRSFPHLRDLLPHMEVARHLQTTWGAAELPGSTLNEVTADSVKEYNMAYIKKYLDKPIRGGRRRRKTNRRRRRRIKSRKL